LRHKKLSAVFKDLLSKDPYFEKEYCFLIREKPRYETLLFLGLGIKERCPTGGTSRALVFFASYVKKLPASCKICCL